jgi:RNA polymerase sigma factor (TIGR02999 family)
LLEDWGNGDRQALEKLTPLVYDELHRLASRYLRQERPGHTLQSTALVNEAYLKLAGQHSVRWQNRAHFFGIAAQMIRRILVDYARTKYAAKRGSKTPRLSLDEALGVPGESGERDLDLVALNDALDALAQIDPRQGRLVELRFFAGLTVEETAEVMQMSPASVKREWTAAKAWLFREIRKTPPDES